MVRDPLGQPERHPRCCLRRLLAAQKLQAGDGDAALAAAEAGVHASRASTASPHHQDDVAALFAIQLTANANRRDHPAVVMIVVRAIGSVGMHPRFSTAAREWLASLADDELAYVQSALSQAIPDELLTGLFRAIRESGVRRADKWARLAQTLEAPLVSELAPAALVGF